MTRKFKFKSQLVKENICFDDWISFPYPKTRSTPDVISIIELNASKTVTFKNVDNNSFHGYEVHIAFESEEDAMIIKLLLG